MCDTFSPLTPPLPIKGDVEQFDALSRSEQVGSASLPVYIVLAFLILVSISATGSVIDIILPPSFLLPACFSYAGDLTLVSKLPEADPANTVFSEVSMRSAADLAAVVSTSGELRSPLLLDLH